jgi:predicted nucleic acid-binding Zn ribbon protein
MGRRTSAIRRRGAVSVGAALEDLTRQLGIRQTLAEYEVLTSWEKLVGEQIAKVTSPERFDNGVLFVSVATGPWRVELSLRRLEIKERINKTAGRTIVKDIRFR